MTGAGQGSGPGSSGTPQAVSSRLARSRRKGAESSRAHRRRRAMSSADGGASLPVSPAEGREPSGLPIPTGRSLSPSFSCGADSGAIPGAPAPEKTCAGGAPTFAPSFQARTSARPVGLSASRMDTHPAPWRLARAIWTVLLVQPMSVANRPTDGQQDALSRAYRIRTAAVTTARVLSRRSATRSWGRAANGTICLTAPASARTVAFDDIRGSPGSRFPDPVCEAGSGWTK